MANLRLRGDVLRVELGNSVDNIKLPNCSFIRIQHESVNFFCYYNPALLSFFNLIISIGVLLSTRDTNVFVCSSHKEAEEWRTVFWVTFVIYVVGMLLFCLLMSADQQPWANGHEGKKNGEREEIKMEEES